MEDPEFRAAAEEGEEDILGMVDWDNLFDEFPLSPNFQLPLSSNSSPDSRIIEKLLMEDDDADRRIDAALVDSVPQFCNDFFADILVDSPFNSSGDTSTVSPPAASSDDQEKKENDLNDMVEELEVILDGATNHAQDPNDPGSKKLRRQLRNRDAAVRSRERKKMYVKDLEIKNKYLEAECRRLGRLLQCFVAENQALRLSLQKGGAFGVTSAKQESAVLLLESLLLGSLLWFLAIMCLFTPHPMSQSSLVEVPPESVEEKALENLAPRRVGSEICMWLTMEFFANSRQFKASRARMKPKYLLPIFV